MALIIIIRHYYCYYVAKFAPQVNIRESPSCLFRGLPHLVYLDDFFLTPYNFEHYIPMFISCQCLLILFSVVIISIIEISSVYYGNAA